MGGIVMLIEMKMKPTQFNETESRRHCQLISHKFAAIDSLCFRWQNIACSNKVSQLPVLKVMLFEYVNISLSYFALRIIRGVCVSLNARLDQ
eukprot:EST45375.1 Hypothetical protein SS50377_14706 [Spironucleus salmonicida]